MLRNSAGDPGTIGQRGESGQGNLTQMQSEMMDEIPFGSPPHRSGHHKPNGMISVGIFVAALVVVIVAVGFIGYVSLIVATFVASC